MEEDNFLPAEKVDIKDLVVVFRMIIGGKSRSSPIRLLSRYDLINGWIGRKTIVEPENQF